MVVLCAIFNCQNSAKRSKIQNVAVFGFPKNPVLRSLWLEATKDHIKTNVKLENYGICKSHFLPEDSEIPGSTKLNWNAVPSLFEGIKKYYA